MTWTFTTTLGPGLRRGDERAHAGGGDERVQAAARRASYRRRPVSSVFVLAALLMLGACTKPAATADTSFELSAILGGDDTAAYLRAEAPRSFSFPTDHGPHPGYRNEWWYFTGNLETAEGRRFAYQVTFFNAALPTDETARPDSAWYSERLWMAHIALTDVESGAHYPRERFSRENPGLAGAQLEPFRVWLEDWQLRGAADGSWQLQVSDAAFALDLSLSPVKAPVLQGRDGLSQKSPEPGNASYYYSITRIATRGSLRLGAASFAVEGSSWLDREWSTSALADDQSGWDWFSLQFDDNQELMYYQLRSRSGAAHPNSEGNWTDAAGQQTLITAEDLELEERDTWTSPSGIDYTTAWLLRYAGRTWRVEAVLDAQWMNLSIPYWEGAVVVLDERGAQVGRGFLEMVRE